MAGVRAGARLPRDWPRGAVTQAPLTFLVPKSLACSLARSAHWGGARGANRGRHGSPQPPTGLACLLGLRTVSAPPFQPLSPNVRGKVFRKRKAGRERETRRGAPWRRSAAGLVEPRRTAPARSSCRGAARGLGSPRARGLGTQQGQER